MTPAQQFNRRRAVAFARWRREQLAARRDRFGVVRFKHHVGFWRAWVEIGETRITTTYWAQHLLKERNGSTYLGG